MKLHLDRKYEIVQKNDYGIKILENCRKFCKFQDYVILNFLIFWMQIILYQKVLNAWIKFAVRVIINILYRRHGGENGCR